MLLINDYIEIESIKVSPQRNEEIEGIGSGQILRAELTEPLWNVEINIPISEFNTGRRIRALLNDIDRPQSHFRVSDPISQFAANDPTGTLLTSVSLGSRSGNQVSFIGQPEGYQFSMGDTFHCEFGGRHYYFEISQDGDGLVRTTPTIPAFIILTTPCVFIRPEIRVQMMELQHGVADSASWKMSGFQIKTVQKL